MQELGFDLDVTKAELSAGYEIGGIFAKEYNNVHSLTCLFNLVAIMGEGSEKSECNRSVIGV